MQDPEFMTKRKLLTRRKFFGTLLAGGAGAFVHARWIEPDWVAVTHRTVSCPNLPPTLNGLRLGVLADIHYDPTTDESLLSDAVDRLLAEKPDLIVLPGDFIESNPHVIRPMMDHLKKLEAPHGVFASMGNHDGWHSALAGRNGLRRSFERCGFSFLLNDHSRITLRGESLAIAATDFVWLGKADAERTLRGIPSTTPVIALVHEPDYFDQMTWVRPITLQVSGHTHGGQCCVPGINYAPVKVKYGEKYIEGVYQKNNSRLFVTRGLGTTGLRVRFACRPEVAILTLKGNTGVQPVSS